MKDKKDMRDIIIKIVLIIIIILLLIHNCSLLKKKGKEKVPSGNVNIIEIICEDDNKCDVNPDENKKDTVTADSQTETSNGKRESTGNTEKSNRNTTSGTSSSTTNDTANNVEEDDEKEEVTIFDSDVKWMDTTQLKIFTDSVYRLEGKIAPESSNTYQFVVKNSTKYKLNYNISFIETNPHHINMKYKLKKNDTYLVDHYVSFDELNVSEQILNSKTNDTFYLEWKWISSDNDTEVGNIQANYALKIEVKAESV